MNARDIGALTLQDVINVAEASKARGATNEALEIYRQWLTSNANHSSRVVALFNFGVLAAECGDLVSAIAAYQEAISRAPAFSAAFINLGLAFEKQNKVSDAIACWEAAYKCADEAGALHSAGGPDETRTTALNHIGRLSESKKVYDSAEQSLAQSLSINPKQSDAAQHWFHLRQRQCKWLTDWANQPIPENFAVQSMSPLASLAYSDDPVHHMAVAQAFVARKFPFKENSLWNGPLQKREKFRIGYVSGDLCTHAVGLLMDSWIQSHDKNKFEIFAFDYSPEDGSETRSALKNAFDFFISIREMSDLEAANLIRRCDIDVLIDMHGLSSGARPRIFAERPAATNVAYLGFLGTTAMPWIDYVLVDNYVVPTQFEKYYSESLLRLPNSIISVVDKEPRNLLPDALDGLINSKIANKSLGCLNNSYKFTQGLVSIWGRALAVNKDWTITVLDDNSNATNNILECLKGSGAAPTQIKLFKRGSFAGYQKALESFSLYLDTYPYNAGSTAKDVLIARTPMLTLSGRSYMSRVGGSVLSNAGLWQGVADSAHEYEAKLLHLMGSTEALREYTATVAALPLDNERVKANVAVFERVLTKILGNI